MAEKTSLIDLYRFTFDSLYFCGTPLETLRGRRFLIAVNDWYMSLIRSGWSVPLAFVIDVGAMLLQPGTGFRIRWRDDHPGDVKALALDYYKMLRGLRHQPIFEGVVDLLADTQDETRRQQAVKTFLRFLLAELSQFRETYAFNTRSLRVLSARPTATGIANLELVIGGQKRAGNLVFGDPSRKGPRNLFGTLFEMMRAITDYYTQHPLREFISPEEWLMVEVAARSTAGIGRVDYRFLHSLLSEQDLSDVEEIEPRPRMVEKVLPTDSYEVDGPVGGYIDINRRRFTGSLAEILPVEMSLFRNRALMFHKLLNEGAMHFVRENIECIEEELRVLFCFVIDADSRMMRSPSDLDPSFTTGMTPYVRARALASLLIKDLAQYLPRVRVKADLAVYLWSAKARYTYRAEIDLFAAWSREAAADRFRFAASFAACAPHVFYNQLGADSLKENIAMDRDPGEYFVHRSRLRQYHCRHLVVLTSSPTAEFALPQGELHMVNTDHSGDSIFVICCDVQRATLGLSRARTIQDAIAEIRGDRLGQIGQLGFRANFLETVLLKGAGRTTPAATYGILGDLP